MNIYEVELVEIVKKNYVVSVQATDEDNAIDKAYESFDNNSLNDETLVDQYISNVEFIQRVGQSDELSHYN